MVSKYPMNVLLRFANQSWRPCSLTVHLLAWRRAEGSWETYADPRPWMAKPMGNWPCCTSHGAMKTTGLGCCLVNTGYMISALHTAVWLITWGVIQVSVGQTGQWGRDHHGRWWWQPTENTSSPGEHMAPSTDASRRSWLPTSTYAALNSKSYGWSSHIEVLELHPNPLSLAT